MKKLKVITVIGTRPEIIRLSMVINKLDKSEAIEHILVHSGQNYDYELNEVFFEDLELRKPDYFLNAAGVDATETIGNCIINIDPILEKEKPDAFLLLGDTNSAFCTISAKKRHIPIFHMEAGNRCFDQRVPEEVNRRLVDHISDVNLAYSDIARECLLAEGLPAATSIKTGGPMLEILTHYLPKVSKSKILDQLNLTKENFFVVSAHREENIASEKNFLNLCKVLNSVAERYNMPIIVTTHPRTRKMIEQYDVKFNPLVKLEKPFNLSDYLSLQLNAKAVLSDSGTLSEESSILNFPALHIREAHERHEAMEEAAVMMVGLNPERIMQGLEVISTQKRGEQRTLKIVEAYNTPNFSDKILRIILSYTDYVKRVVWSE